MARPIRQCPFTETRTPGTSHNRAFQKRRHPEVFNRVSQVRGQKLTINSTDIPLKPQFNASRNLQSFRRVRVLRGKGGLIHVSELAEGRTRGVFGLAE
jgi:hypothetical protein